MVTIPPSQHSGIVPIVMQIIVQNVSQNVPLKGMVELRIIIIALNVRDWQTDLRFQTLLNLSGAGSRKYSFILFIPDHWF